MVQENDVSRAMGALDGQKMLFFMLKFIICELK